MPYSFETQHIPIPREADRRVKLTEEQRKAIRESASPVRQLAREYGVDRRAIDFIKHPEKLKANKQRRKERGGQRQYYDRDQNRLAVMRHQRYKQWVLTERQGGNPAIAIARAFVKDLQNKPFHRIIFDSWAGYNVPWATKEMRDSVWETLNQAMRSVCSIH